MVPHGAIEPECRYRKLEIPPMPRPSPRMAQTVPDAGDRLQLMETFVRIVEAGSLSAAAAQLSSTQPTVSRRLTALERSLGVRLLQRTTHVMRLTVDGERCYKRAKELLASWAAFEADVRGAQEEPQGTLRVAMPHAFGQDRLVEPLARFLHAYPRVSVEWLLKDDVVDFIGEGIDCAMQAGEAADPSVVAVRLWEVERIVVASPALLADAPLPAVPEDLAPLSWLALRTFYRNEIALTHGVTGEKRRIAISPRVSTDNLYALRSAALLGLGACLASAWVMAEALEDKRLVQLVPDWRAPALPIYIIYPYARFYPSRLLRFVEMMRESVSATLPGI